MSWTNRDTEASGTSKFRGRLWTRRCARASLLSYSVVFLISWACAAAPSSQSRGAAPIDATATEAAAAAAYYDQDNKVDALPLYEHLAERDPNSALYAERLAVCLMVRFLNLPTGGERTATIARARAAAERAKSLGDSSDLLAEVLETTQDPDFAENTTDPRIRAAEAAFAKGDLDAALAGYQAAATSDLNSYEARLYAGDVYFRKHDVKDAGEWFQKAVAVDPNRETAYRYWGDALAAAGDQTGALEKYVEAVVAEPYNRRPWMTLHAWAKDNSATIKAPHVPVPPAPSVVQDASGKSTIAINFDPKVTKDSGAVWLTYLASRAQWRSETFAKRFPEENEYRHSLAEEVESLEVALQVLSELNVPEGQVDPALRDLVLLGRDKMLQPYVLLSAPDEGIAKDYARYRATNREQLRIYVKTYLIHRT